jgi:mannitol/fructose-specific phosphotransferase system IIA component (Ntr-type)
MVLSTMVALQDIVVDLAAEDKAGVLEELVGVLAANHPGLDAAEVLVELHVREDKMSTAIFPAIAVPHASVSSVSHLLCAIGLSKKGVDFDSFDDQPTHIFFLVVSGQDHQDHQLHLLQKLSFVLNDKAFVATIMEKKSPQAVLDALRYFESMAAL